ncbi:hypothetical protein M569_11410, partial [Genlisea aurea]
MEDKRRDSAEAQPPLQPAATSTDVPATENPSSSRRRGGGAAKRKSTFVNSSGSGSGGSSTSTPLTNSSKRQAREKPPAVPFPPIHTNGPCTRARVHPHGGSSTAASFKRELEVLDSASKGNKDSSEDLCVLEAEIEADYEATRSRGANVHVVPFHAGWFMWKKIHTLEETMLPSFFNGKKEGRNRETYMAIRNAIMEKFHSNPNEQIEAKHLSELTMGELDARKEIMEFLDYWGLINYHPLPPFDSEAGRGEEEEEGEAAELNSLVEQLFQFETVKSWTPSTPRMNLEVPAMPSGLFPESVAVDEFMKSEGPSVEYHCNSCSADCSRKRYHCQKQADFDLCADCFNDGKFGSDMAPSDFILMEPAEAAGTSGGNWTDQETLLLLEAIELFRDNWSEIAEHVATKTKAQCILHFVQMPIEDAFFKNDGPSKEPIPVNTDEPTVKADPDGGDASGNRDSVPAETSNPKESVDRPETVELKALKEAFEAVGSYPLPGERLSFAASGNPVMTLTAFLVRLADRNAVTASVRSLQNLTSGEELAARHCFALEDPPNDNVEGPPSVAAAAAAAIQSEVVSLVEKSEKNPDPVVAPKTSAESGAKKRKKSSSDSKAEPLSSRRNSKKSSARKGSRAVREEAQQQDPGNEQQPASIPNGHPADKSENVADEEEEEAVASFPEKNDAAVSAKGNPATGDNDTGERGETKDTVKNLKRAAASALAGAAVKAKLLADQEEDQILRLSAFLIEKQ